MKNLVPQITIVIIGVIGLIVSESIWGLFGGLGLGYVLVTLFGLLLMSFSGGILPRKVRRETAQSFLKLNTEWLHPIIPSEYKGREVIYVEVLLEKIVQKAAVIGPSTSSGMSYAEVSSAVEILKSEEKNPNVIHILEHLWVFLETDWYSI